MLRVTLNEMGLRRVAVCTTVIDTPGEALRREFTGSPTILINDTDPWAPLENVPALACRLYPSSGGMPDQHELAAALHAAVLDDTTPGNLAGVNPSGR